MFKSVTKPSKTIYAGWDKTFCDFHFFLTRIVSCCSLYSWVWGCTLKHQFECMVQSASHFADLDMISTAIGLCSAVSPNSPLFEGWYNDKLGLQRLEDVSCDGFYLRVRAQELIFPFCPVINLGHNTEWTQMNSIRTASVTKNTNVNDFSISDGTSAGPPEKEFVVKYAALRN